MRILILFAFFTSGVIRLHAQQPSAPPPPVSESPRPVGGEVDAHGCRPSAGYQWSQVRNSCIRLWEAGISLDAKAPGLDTTTVAYIVFKSDTEDAKAELFLPGQKNSAVLNRIRAQGGGTWKNSKYVLTQWKGMYTLRDRKKQILYEGPASRR